MKSVSFDPAVLKQIRALPRAERQLVGRGIQLAQQLFGQTHKHSGAGLRKSSRGFYEVRVGLSIRLVFENAADTLHFVSIGDLAAVQRFLKR